MNVAITENHQTADRYMLILFQLTTVLLAHFCVKEASIFAEAVRF